MRSEPSEFARFPPLQVIRRSGTVGIKVCGEPIRPRLKAAGMRSVKQKANTATLGKVSDAH